MRARDQRLARREERRIDLGESLRELEIDHPRDERALERGASATQNVEARARHLGSARDVEDPELLTDLPVRLGGEAARGEHVAHFLGVLADALESRHSSACHYPCSPMYDVVLVAFEGPDRYSFVGGLATRMIDLADALVDRGYFVHHVFVGDPKLPPREERADGRLILERWSQWISAYHPRDVYDGEDGKWRDFSRTVPAHLANLVTASAAEGRKSVLLFEDWQTADAAIATAAILNVRMPGAAAILWNANNTYGFGSVDFPLLRLAASITTV